MKIMVEERDETQRYRPAPIEQLFEMIKIFDDRIIVYVPNMCGGETKVTIFKSSIPDGNTDNLTKLKMFHSKP